MLVRAERTETPYLLWVGELMLLLWKSVWNFPVELPHNPDMLLWKQTQRSLDPITRCLHTHVYG